MKNILYWFIEGQTYFGMSRGAKLRLALNIRNRLLFIQIQPVPLRLHYKWIEINDIVCKTTNGKPLGTDSQEKVY
jgi:hypothetical protein